MKQLNNYSELKYRFVDGYLFTQLLFLRDFLSIRRTTPANDRRRRQWIKPFAAKSEVEIRRRYPFCDDYRHRTSFPLIELR